MQVILLMTDQEDHVFNMGRVGDRIRREPGVVWEPRVVSGGLGFGVWCKQGENYEEIGLSGFWADGRAKVGHWGRGGGGGPC